MATATTPIIGAIIVILKPSTTNDEFITNAFGVHTKIIDPLNLNFGTNFVWSVSMATFFGHVTDLDMKQKGMKLSPPTYTAINRNDAKKIVKADLKLLVADVEQQALLNAATAESVVESVNMLLRGSTAHLKYVGVKNTKVAGRIQIYAAEAGYHEWAQLNDDGVTWTSLRAGKKATKTVSGLTIGKAYTFRSASINATEDGTWTVYTPIIVSTLT